MTQQLDTRQLAAMFKALGDPTRLRIFGFLRDCCCGVALSNEGEVRPMEGKTMGEVCCAITGLGTVTSTISFHLKELRLAGLVDVERRGKFMVCAVNQGGLATLRQFVGQEHAGEAACEETR